MTQTLPIPFYMLCGSLGAGKTTLIRILTTLMRQSSGEVLVECLDPRSHSREICSLIGVVSQENSLDRYITARENLELHVMVRVRINDSY